mmetsp:Transcript_15903/g.36818  ORF Transcript_15903/g.36818 Transcript_15903/m.36818 type:complete len:506 (+) Transcript_15903:52-1569(+)|eukprot:CAMPEP_0197190074 /NCGR_PEP_ID=MMETSP1423-20130617/20957_1 /TAXON_ID=476441 /ORGANISM="Pseudo-nitzschia heimii, Strain UNC1101" /LENGTH=505 /DNA_ID=CAMNT_0042642365 /DNA_START=48 /DNA_END=1565 /DNA_ORIENTATION=+
MNVGNNFCLYLSVLVLHLSHEFLVAFQPVHQESQLSAWRARSCSDQHKRPLSAFKVSVDELEKDLTPAERSVTGVVRLCGPSVALVRSVLPSVSDNGSGRSNNNRRGRNGRRRRSRPNQSANDAPNTDNLPRGNDLGSGSGFVVSDGYICTNFHVIEQAYTLRKNAELAEHAFDDLAGNLTGGLISHDLLNITKSLLQRQFQEVFDVSSLPEVFVRISSSNRFQKCRIVDVNPDIDLAVLKIIDASNTTAELSSIEFGSSSDLLVGQTVVAIGNPFGLQSTVTAGVVSAVNREFRAGTARTPANVPVRNVIQTDAAINPGNSGGPLLNLKNEVVGINTAIITTSGSSAGIGFAIPSDQIRPVVERILQKDRIENGLRPNQGWLGISVVRQEVTIPEANASASSSVNGTNCTMTNLAKTKNWVAEVVRNSPAESAGIAPLVLSSNGSVEYGDAIVAVGGNEVADFEELRTELEKCVVGEQIAITLQDAEDKRRVVYATLERKPPEA